MRVDTERIRKFLDRSDFAGLFNFLGWDNPHATTLPGTEQENSPQQVAVKRGVGVWQIDGIPGSQERRLIDRDISRRTRERLLIFVEGDHQLWMWPETRQSGVGHHLITHEYQVGTMNEHLVQRLSGIRFHVAEEDDLTVMDVLNRVRGQFKADKITKKFYKEFKKHHEELTEFIEGIENLTDRSWYGSVLLNRLMFIYFLQKKGFLEGDRDYLRNRLDMVRELLGKDSFYGFFRKFLLPLFHEGFGSHQHLYDDPEIAEIIGEIPYVNGAIFDPHHLEEQYDIDIPDCAFKLIFEFFDNYRWHLDEKPTFEPNEINPDVLGYIFEQVVNQKEPGTEKIKKDKGAYYTKRDITGYMTSVTVIPALLDRLDVTINPMKLLISDPERYIYDSISYGAYEELPDKIAAGTDNPALIVDEDWFAKSPPNIGLPGETWWETIDRHRHFRELKKRLEDGEIRTVDDAITANLDLRTLVTDFLENVNSIESVESIYRTLQDLTVLDPTCGSGAFLFAALDILADCYKTLLDRAEELSIGNTTPDILREAEEHPNRMYFIYKQAMLNNLYGVDLMRDASEIARLRMFLKLASQLTDPNKIEALPDLDFNIKTGNLLVGIVHPKDAEERLGMDLLGLNKLDDIKREAKPLGNLMIQFSQIQQQDGNPAIIQSMKEIIKTEQENLRVTLNRCLYEIRAEQDNFDQWVDSHQPFHWFVEFPTVFQAKDGFDVIAGNPPYIRRKKVIKYQLKNLKTGNLPDIYPPCIERSLHLSTSQSRFAMIVPHSLQFSSQYKLIRKILSEYLPTRWISTYDNGPDRLFEGVDQRVVIQVGSTQSTKTVPNLATTKFNRWIKKYRKYLFENLRYTNIPSQIESNQGWLKFGSSQEITIISNLLNYTIISKLTANGDYQLSYKKQTRYYLSTFLEEPPAYDANQREIKQSEIQHIEFSDSISRIFVFGFSLSKICLLWWAIQGDGFHVTKGDICSTPLPYVNHLMERIIQLIPEIEEKLYATLTFTGNANQCLGNYDVRKIRNLTDQIDKLVLRELGLEDHWPALQIFYSHFTKQAKS